MENKNSSRRSFLTKTLAGVTGSVVASSIPVAALAGKHYSDSIPSDTTHRFLTQPYLQAPSTDGMTIMWLTNQLCLNWVEFGETEQLGSRAQQTKKGMLNTHTKINCVSLNNLKPNTKYFYKVCSKQILDFQPYKMTFGETISSDIYHFTTLDPHAVEVNWLVMNDIHDRPNTFKDLLQINGDHPYDFVFLNGDMFDYLDNEKQIIDHLLEPCSQFSASKPLFYVRGNHETRGHFSRDFLNYYHNYNNNEYYTFQWGPVFAIVLDTGEDKPDNHPVYGGANDFDAYREEQAIWLEQQMNTKAFRNAKFRVVMMHIPHLHSDDWHGTKECNRLFGPLFEKYKIDLFLAGHTHKHGIYKPDENHSYHFVIGGGPFNGIRTLIRIRANTKTLTLQMLKDNGSLAGEFTIPSKRSKKHV